MKIVVSVDELASEARLVIDNMLRSNAAVMIGDDPGRPRAVLLSAEEYERLQKRVEAAEAALRNHQSAPAPEMTQPLEPAPRFDTPRPLIPNLANSHPKPTAPETSEPPGSVAQRTAAAVQADRASSTPPMPTIVSQRQSTLQPDPALAGRKDATPIQGARLNRPLTKPPRPIQNPKSGMKLPFSIESVPGGWQTIALIAGVSLLGLVGVMLILNAFG